MHNLTKEELKDLLQILAPLYLSAFTESVKEYAKPVKKLYANLKADLKNKTSEYEYEEAMKDVLDYCRKFSEMDAEQLAQTMTEAAIESQKVAKKV